jgi:hypothetical protein
LDQGNVIKKRGTGLAADEKIEITAWAGLSLASEPKTAIG